MNDYNQNPLHELGAFDWRDYRIFKSHLRLPAPYPYIIFKNYTDLHVAVCELPKLFDKHSEYLWEKRCMNAEYKEKLYKVSNIPVQYHKPGVYITESPKDQADVAFVEENIERVMGTGKVFYFHSAFGENALRAAASITKAAVDRHIKCYCVSFPNILDTIKKWDADDPAVIRLSTVEVLVLWAVGSEYTTEFTNTQLNSIVQSRRADGHTTILVSSLSPKEYKARYGDEPDGIVVAFKDTKLKQTLSDLKRELEK